jgi:hypothetical protein
MGPRSCVFLWILGAWGMGSPGGPRVNLLFPFYSPHVLVSIPAFLGEDLFTILVPFDGAMIVP